MASMYPSGKIHKYNKNENINQKKKAQVALVGDTSSKNTINYNKQVNNLFTILYLII